MDDLKPIAAMPLYRSHKLVHATKVTSLAFDEDSARVTFSTDHGQFNIPTRADTEYAEGGYVVAYADDYISYSPAEAFEQGYTLVVGGNASIVATAKICHEANRAFCQSLGDDSQAPWDEAPEWQQMSAINGVVFHLANPEAGDCASHDNWMAEKVAQGWVWGPVKDAENKTHPCIMAFDLLPPEQRFKDKLFRAIVHSAKV